MFSKNTKEVCVLLKISLFPHRLQDKMKMPSTARCFPGSQPPSPGLSILNLAPFPSDTLCPASPRPQELLPVLGASLPHHLPCVQLLSPTTTSPRAASSQSLSAHPRPPAVCSDSYESTLNWPSVLIVFLPHCSLSSWRPGVSISPVFPVCSLRKKKN